MLLFIYFCLFIAVVALSIGISGYFQASGTRIPFPEAEAQAKRMRRRSYILFLFPFTPKLLEKLKLNARIKNRLDAAHLKLAPEEFFNLKLLLIAFFIAGEFPFLKKVEPIAIAAAIIFGFILPDLWLNRRIARRKQAIVQVLPETVDLLGLCVEGGLDFTTSLKWVIEKTSSNPMIEELAFVLEEIKWGKPRSQALKDMSRRLNIPEITSFVQTLVQAERMGTPVTEAFAILSEDTRMQRFHRGERIALQAPIKILIPLIFCILPVIAIIVGGPILLQFMQGGIVSKF